MRRRFIFLLLILPALLAPTYGYLGWRLAAGWGWALLALPFLSVLSFVFVARSRMTGKGGKTLDAWVSRAAYMNMGVVSFLLVATLARDLGGLAFGHWANPAAVVSAAIAMLLVGAYGGFFGPSVRHVELRFPELPAALKGLRIVQVSDLHLSSHLGWRYASRVARKVIAAKPDLIAFTGDIGDGRVADLSEAIAKLQPLSAVAPTFYVPGNHEAYWNMADWLAAFRGVGMKVLMNEGATISLKGESIFVGGITDPACEPLGFKPDIVAAAKGMDGAHLKVLLSHRPDPAEAASQAGFDLQLSGHTHGGQFFPWTLVAAYVHRYSLGLYQVGKMWIYVSAGTGSWGPRLRLGTRAEVTVLELG